MGAMLCILAFAAGHLWRDGTPSYKDILAGLVGTRWEWLYHLSTQLARVTGALLCGLGALGVFSAGDSALIAAGVLAGFYADARHGDGQQARGWGDVKYLLLSGITSLIPLMFLAFTADVHFALLPLVGLIKPGIWFAAWYVRPDRWHPWLEPTRVSAIAFGGALGAAVAVAA
jgi:hypothetical protein